MEEPTFMGPFVRARVHIVCLKIFFSPSKQTEMLKIRRLKYLETKSRTFSAYFFVPKRCSDRIHEQQKVNIFHWLFDSHSITLFTRDFFSSFIWLLNPPFSNRFFFTSILFPNLDWATDKNTTRLFLIRGNNVNATIVLHRKKKKKNKGSFLFVESVTRIVVILFVKCVRRHKIYVTYEGNAQA